MSDGMREWRLYVDDMIAFAEKVLAYTAGLDQNAFVSNALVYDATLRNLELIGEAATHVPEDVRQAHPQVPWRMIIATRNRLIHAYLGIDNDTLWSIVVTDVPALLPALRAVRAPSPG
ncbi:MAG: DUF86 domain-containing protein [Burkholderiales bacterium]|nr:DUF86 domain-containing protein [Burkholderiales bacterium]